MSLSILDGLHIIEKVILSSKKTLYICKCRSNLCKNTIKVRPSNRHGGYCKSCASGHKRKRPYEALYNCFITSATNNKIIASLSYEDFHNLCEQKECHYCQSPTIRSEYKNSTWSTAYMIDRKDNNLPYVINNCVTCCWKCNDLKSDRFTYDQFLQIAALIKTF